MSTTVLMVIFSASTFYIPEHQEISYSLYFFDGWCAGFVPDSSSSSIAQDFSEAENIHSARIQGLEARLADQSNFFSTSIGVISLVLTLISIAVGVFVFKQSRKVDELYTTYSTKLNDLSKNQLDFSGHSVEIEKQRLMIQAVKNSLSLETIHYSADTLLSKVYQQIIKLEKAIKEYKGECNNSEGNAYQELCEAKLAVANELVSECRDYCSEAVIKLKHIKGSLASLKDGTLRDELDMKLKSTWVRAHVASALIYKRHWEITKSPSALSHAITELKSCLAEAKSLPSTIDKARVFFNLSCYQCLSGDVEEASKTLEKAEYLNHRYKLSSRHDTDLQEVFVFRDA